MVGQGKSKFESMISVKIGSTKSQMLVREIRDIVVQIFDRISQFIYGNKCTGVCFVVHNVVDPVLYDRQRLDVIYKPLEGHFLSISAIAMLPTDFERASEHQILHGSHHCNHSTYNWQSHCSTTHPPQSQGASEHTNTGSDRKRRHVKVRIAAYS